MGILFPQSKINYWIFNKEIMEIYSLKSMNGQRSKPAYSSAGGEGLVLFVFCSPLSLLS